MITIICDGKIEQLGEKICKRMQTQCASIDNIKFISTNDKELKPCYSCGGCETKTFGRCVIRDDMDNILPIMADSQTWVILTRILWGNPAYEVKKILDKSALLGNRFYKIRHGELVKGTEEHLDIKKIVFIGVGEDTQSKSSKDFIFWANEMGNIMDLKREVYVVMNNPDDAEISKLVKDMI